MPWGMSAVVPYYFAHCNVLPSVHGHPMDSSNVPWNPPRCCCPYRRTNIQHGSPDGNKLEERLDSNHFSPAYMALRCQPYLDYHRGWYWWLLMGED